MSLARGFRWVGSHRDSAAAKWPARLGPVRREGRMHCLVLFAVNNVVVGESHQPVLRRQIRSEPRLFEQCDVVTPAGKEGDEESAGEPRFAEQQRFDHPGGQVRNVGRNRGQCRGAVAGFVVEPCRVLRSRTLQEAGFITPAATPTSGQSPLRGAPESSRRSQRSQRSIQLRSTGTRDSRNPARSADFSKHA